MDDLRWLFRTYDPQIIRDVFLNKPLKIYTRPAFHFCKLLLGLAGEEVPAYRYDHAVLRRTR